MKPYLLLGLAVLLVIFWSGCSKKRDNPIVPAPVTHSAVYGTWQDTAGNSYNFSDTLWWSGLNSGKYSGDQQGTLYLLGQPYATFSLSGGILTITFLFDNKTITMNRISTTLPVNPGTSSLTRQGNFIALVSDRSGDSKGDIYIYTVDSNAHLDTVYYFDTTITSSILEKYDTVRIDSLTTRIDTLRTTVYDTILERHFIEPIRALTNRAGLDDMPAWSPDGDKLAFVSDRGGYQAIWIYFLDGFANPLPVSDSLSANPVQLTDPGLEKVDANPSWSPDGKYITFERKSGAENLRDVFIIASDDYGEADSVRNLTKAPTADCFNPEWAPKTEINIILFEERNSGTSSDWDIFWMAAADTVGFDSVSHSNKVTNPNRNGHPTWSPDCKMVAYERNPPGNDSAYDIQIQTFSDKADSTNDTAIVRTLTNQTDWPGLNRYPTWLPNGNLIAFVRENNLYLIDLSHGMASPVFRKLLDDNYHYWAIAW